jgi:hypothetical protein
MNGPTSSPLHDTVDRTTTPSLTSVIEAVPLLGWTRSVGFFAVVVDSTRARARWMSSAEARPAPRKGVVRAAGCGKNVMGGLVEAYRREDGRLVSEARSSRSWSPSIDASTFAAKAPISSSAEGAAREKSALPIALLRRATLESRAE